QHQTPYSYDASQTEALFPAASYQYILYGMGFETTLRPRRHFARQAQRAEQLFNENGRKTQQLRTALPTNRQLLDKIRQFGLPKL
ncbi:MAG: tryptophan halogenase, partial [Phenylobacterium sp.]